MIPVPELQGKGRGQSRGVHDNNGHPARYLSGLHESEADPANVTHQIRGEGCFHEQRLSNGNTGTHALRLYPCATGVC